MKVKLLVASSEPQKRKVLLGIISFINNTPNGEPKQYKLLLQKNHSFIQISTLNNTLLVPEYYKSLCNYILRSSATLDF